MYSFLVKNLLEDNPLIIVDVGASGGIHERWLKYGSGIKTILFEPDYEEFKKLVSKKSENSLVINSALAEKSKVVDFNICKKQQVSSIYTPNQHLLHRYEDSERFNIERTVSLKADSLDNLLQKENINEIDFIKIDAQGSELDILKGATNFYENLIGLEVEVEFIELYHKQPLFSEVNSFIESKGFSLIDLRRYFWKRKRKNYSNRKGQLIFADALYFKEPENIIALNNLNEKKIIRSFHTYLAYGYDDLARTLLELSEKGGLLTQESKEGIKELLKQYKAAYVLPDFKGKGRIKNLINYLGAKFEVNEIEVDEKNYYSGTNKKIGN
jgi:FkbM family methyltransferase